MDIDSTYNVVKSWPNDSTNWEDASMQTAIELHTFLKQSNEKMLNQALDLFHSDPSQNETKKMENNIKNIKSIKEDSLFRESQKKSSLNTFLNKYLFLIIKLLFLIILLIMLFYTFIWKAPTTQNIPKVINTNNNIKRLNTNTINSNSLSQNTNKNNM